MEDIISKVYQVYGDHLPTRLVYNAMTNKPTSTATILKKFKRWTKFELAYAEHCMAKRKEAADLAVKTKPLAPKVVKKVVKREV